MSTLLYSPGIKVYISTEPEKGESEVLDVSEDLVRGQMQRRSDGVSTFQFSLQNTRRKYDRVFKPNDRIIVMMKRLTWVRVFTGYLNKVPLVTAWPKTVDLTASCSLKRLQYWYWDPNYTHSFETVLESLTAGREESDGGMANLALTLLNDVVGWPEEKVHIGAIPEDWFAFAKQIAEQVGARAEEADAMAEQYYSALQAPSVGGGGSGGGGGGSLGGEVDASALPPGEYGGANLNEEQTKIAVIIYNAGIRNGLNRKAIVALLAVGYAECNFNANIAASATPGDPHAGVAAGIFQQHPDHVGATPEQVRDPEWAANFAASEMKEIQDNGRVERSGRRLGMSPLTGDTNFDTAPIKDIAWVLQAYDYTGAIVAGIPERYEGYTRIAEAIVDTITSNGGSGGSGGSLGNSTESGSGSGGNSPGGASGGGSTSGGNSTSGGAGNTSSGSGGGGGSGRTTGQDIARRGMETANYYIQERGGPLKYSQTMDRSQNMEWDIDRVQSHDCSSFTRWVFFHEMGKDIGSYTGEQCACVGRGRRISIEEALQIRGSLLFRGGHTHQHVAISLGDGSRTVETGSDTPSGRLQIKENRWTGGGDHGLLVHDVDYSADGGGIGMGDVGAAEGGEGGEGGGMSGIEILKYRDQEWSNEETDDYDKIFGNVNWVPQINPEAMMTSAAFTGVRALMNDEPFLPYIRNIMNSTLRSFCSAPNGDFIAWFPDYYGIWGTAGIMRIEPIELQDFQVDWSDDFFVTHQYTQAAFYNKFDTSVGVGFQAANSLLPAVTTIGIASIDIPAMLFAILGVEIEKEEAQEFAKWIYQRFGARPDFSSMPGMVDKKGEFFSAVHLFMKQWAYQYNANVPITFMPELWPGMLIQIPMFDFQAYVTTVNHSFEFGPNGHFSTSINIAAPARMPTSENDRDHALMGLPMAGGLKHNNNTNPGDGPRHPSGEENRDNRPGRDPRPSWDRTRPPTHITNPDRQPGPASAGSGPGSPRDPFADGGATGESQNQMRGI